LKLINRASNLFSHHNIFLRRKYLSTMNSTSNFWSVEDCIKNFDSIKFVTGTCNKGGMEEFEAGPRIKGANYMDIDDIATSPELFPDLNPKGIVNMFPPKALFAAAMDKMGIQNTDQVVVYGRKGDKWTPRIWCLFKLYGVERVGLMHGSLEEFEEMGGPVEKEPISYDIRAKDLMGISEEDSSYKVPSGSKDRIVDMERVLEIVKDNKSKGDDSTPIFDTRGAGGFAKGHIPGAVNVPWSSFLEPDSVTKFKSKEGLEEVLRESGVSNHKTNDVLLSCGACISVCHLAVAMDECGYKTPLLYDGSWGEWGKKPDTPKEVAPEQ